MGGTMGETQNTHICLQPEYVGAFRCDGAACNSKCCKGWAVDIDGPTYQKYCTIEPKIERKKIVSKIKFKKQKGKFIVEMAKNGDCPFLREDGLCRIQKTWGAEWLSNTCTVYPRHMYLAGGLLLRALTMTCPVAANQALLPEEPMAFEEVAIPDGDWEELMRRGTGRIPELPEMILDVQYGSISILQNRALSIDQRLVVLGFFMDQAGDMVEGGAPEKLKELSSVYTAEDFIGQTTDMMRAITFRPGEYVKSMFGLIEALYGRNAAYHGLESMLMQRIVRAFGLENGEIPLTGLLKTYQEQFRPAQEEMLREYSHIFENYLVNEFFLDHYPRVLEGSFVQNYILFVMTYKMTEFMATTMVMTEEPKPDGKRLVELITHMVASLDHSNEFLSALARDTMKRQKNVVECMKNLLFTGEEFSA